MKALLYRLKKIHASHCLAVVFVLFILYVGSAALPQLIDTTVSLSKGNLSLREYIRTTDSQYKNMLPLSVYVPTFKNSGTYINVNGLMANLMDQKFTNDRVKLKNGHLTGVTASTPSDEILQSVADNIASLHSKQAERGKHFLFVMTPCQISKFEDLLPVGYTDTANDTADRLLEMLRERGVQCLDLRDALHEDGITHAEAFFITDHHWTAETGFWAYGKIVEKLSALGYVSEVHSDYIDPDNFNFTIHEKSFLGSSGKRMGIFYAGIDDFCVISPKFDTSIQVKYDGDETQYSGSYADTVNIYYPDCMYEQKDYFLFMPYGTYGHSDTTPVLRTNQNAPENTKLMLIGDSMNNVSFSLMSLYASDCLEVDMRYLNKEFGEIDLADFNSYYQDFNPDTIVLMINPNGCTDTNATFPFFSQEAS